MTVRIGANFGLVEEMGPNVLLGLRPTGSEDSPAVTFEGESAERASSLSVARRLVLQSVQ